MNTTKPLLNKTTQPFLVVVLVVLLVSIPVYYLVVDNIWKSELDEHNRIQADKISYHLNQLHLSDDSLAATVALWNIVQPGSVLTPAPGITQYTDSLYIVEKENYFWPTREIDRYRCLKTLIKINGRPYYFISEINIEESRETIAVIAALTIGFLLVIAVGLVILNKRLSASLWAPFHKTLEQLKAFQLNRQQKLVFSPSDTTEFEALNQSLSRLIDQNLATYQAQKEFTENASHELQTPLAILKNKLDLLYQADALTEKQYEIAEDMNKALTRSTRINQNLLLLAKIDNNQFSKTEQFSLNELVEHSLDLLDDYFVQKRISRQTQMTANVPATGNSALTEILVNNLLLNAIRHTPAGGTIRVVLTSKQLVISNSGQASLKTENLFKRFSRQSADTAGSGLGLAIVQQVCHAQGWTAGYSFQEGMHHFSITL